MNKLGMKLFTVENLVILANDLSEAAELFGKFVFGSRQLTTELSKDFCDHFISKIVEMYTYRPELQNHSLHIKTHQDVLATLPPTEFYQTQPLQRGYLDVSVEILSMLMNWPKGVYALVSDNERKAKFLKAFEVKVKVKMQNEAICKLVDFQEGESLIVIAENVTEAQELLFFYLEKNPLRVETYLSGATGITAVNFAFSFEESQNYQEYLYKGEGVWKCQKAS